MQIHLKQGVRVLTQSIKQHFMQGYSYTNYFGWGVFSPLPSLTFLFLPSYLFLHFCALFPFTAKCPSSQIPLWVWEHCKLPPPPPARRPLKETWPHTHLFYAFRGCKCRSVSIEQSLKVKLCTTF